MATSNNRELAVMNDGLQKKMKNDLFPNNEQDNLSDQVPAIEFPMQAEFKEENDEYEQKNENKFFITENEVLRAKKKIIDVQEPIIQEEISNPNAQK